MKPPLEISLEFTNRVEESTTVIITGDTQEAWIIIRQGNKPDDEVMSVMLDPQEIDVVISALQLFKYRILNPKRRNEDD